MSVAVVLPSRGLVYSQTVEELYRELDALGQPYRVFWSHGRPIPDCFNVPTEEALKGDWTHFLFVEEDMVLPQGILSRMFTRKTYAVACDYPVSGGSGGTVMYDPEGRAFFTGCGLLLVETWLLRKMPKPIWRSDMRWEPYVDEGDIHFKLVVRDDPETYGQQDVAFGLRMYANGYPIEVMDETIGQREMVTKGKPGTNKGFHVVRDRMHVVQRRDLENLRERPVPKLGYEEILIDGKRVKISPELLAKLPFEPERPKYVRSGAGIFEGTDEIYKWLLFDGTR